MKRGRKAGKRAQNPADVSVGQRLRYFRLMKNLSQAELAQKIGMTFQQIQKYEKGQNRISAGMLWEFSRILNIQIQEFFSGLDGNVFIDDVPPLNFKSLRNYLATEPDALRKVLACVAAMA